MWAAAFEWVEDGVLLNIVQHTRLLPKNHLVQNVSSDEVENADDPMTQSTPLSSNVCLCVLGRGCLGKN